MTTIKPLDNHQLLTLQSAVLKLEALQKDLRSTGNKEAASALGDAIENVLGSLDCAKCETCQCVKLAAALASGVCVRCHLEAADSVAVRAEKEIA